MQRKFKLRQERHIPFFQDDPAQPVLCVVFHSARPNFLNGLSQKPQNSLRLRDLIARSTVKKRYRLLLVVLNTMTTPIKLAKPIK
jgi:hypothetical protein